MLLESRRKKPELLLNNTQDSSNKELSGLKCGALRLRNPVVLVPPVGKVSSWLNLYLSKHVTVSAFKAKGIEGAL